MTSSPQPEMSNFYLQNPQAPSQAPSIASLRIHQEYLTSVPATAATSMLTVCPAENEKDTEGGPSPTGEEGQNSEGLRETNPPAATPQVALTFLIVSGNRRTMNFEPETTVGRVKELVWNAWPSDWQDEKPPAPNFLRILYLGKILQDDDTLARGGKVGKRKMTNTRLPLSMQAFCVATAFNGLSLPTSSISPTPPQTHTQNSTIVHLSIRPYAPPPEDEAALKKNLRAARRALSRSASSARPPQAGENTDGVPRSGGCCGCIIC